MRRHPSNGEVLKHDKIHPLAYEVNSTAHNYYHSMFNGPAPLLEVVLAFHSAENLEDAAVQIA
jgi:hypothetical protein